MNESTFFFKGDLAKYTGKTLERYGQTWFEAEIQQGHREGELILTPNPALKILRKSDDYLLQ